MRQSVYFQRPHAVEIRNEPLPVPAPNQLLVKTTTSAISAGTEMLFYRGQVPSEMAVDATIEGMSQTVQYPLAYGYCAVGRVIETGSQIDPRWQNRRVFAFHPHTTHFVSEPSALMPIPDEISDEQALFLPNMETAVNFLMDAMPIMGERVMIFGLGVVGLLTLHLLRKFPIAHLAVSDGYANRTTLAEKWGADIALLPKHIDQLKNFDPDLIIEVSSNPAALASAIDLAGYGTRILVGSWYGNKTAALPLGGKFHRNRIRLISSQVSTVDGQFSNRWDKKRRMQSAWQHLRDLPYQSLITHRIPIQSAPEAYKMLDQQPDQAIQLIFTY